MVNKRKSGTEMVMGGRSVWLPVGWLREPGAIKSSKAATTPSDGDLN